jgi:DNA-directed RNA polymerase subunit E'/Rpb7
LCGPCPDRVEFNVVIVFVVRGEVVDGDVLQLDGRCMRDVAEVLEDIDSVVALLLQWFI